MTSCFLLGKDVSVELFQNVNIENRNYTSATTHMTITVTCYWLESHLMRTMVIIMAHYYLILEKGSCSLVSECLYICFNVWLLQWLRVPLLQPLTFN